MKKVLSCVLLCFLSVNLANAEKEGIFIGGSLLSSIQSSNAKLEYYSPRKEQEKNNNINLYNSVFGYTQNFGDRFSLRYYGGFDIDIDYTPSFTLNADALFSIIRGDKASLRLFAGTWVGLVSFDDYYYYETIWGFDLGLNAGVRVSFLNRHGIEFYGRFGFLKQKIEYGLSESHYGLRSQTLSQPYIIGIRYTFTF